MWKTLLYKYRAGNNVTRLLFINVAVFAVITAFSIVSFLFQLDLTLSTSGIRQLFITDLLSANSDPMLLLQRPWTIVTYMFTHEDLWHIVINMLIFYYIGSIFTELLGNQRILPLYIFGGISGLLLFLVLFNLIPAFNGSSIPIIGASASVMAVMLATATYVPNYPIRLMILGTVPLKYIAGFYVILDVLALRGDANIGGHIAHLGGAIFGFIYAKQLTQGNDLGRFYFIIINSFKGLFKRKPKVRVVHNQKEKKTKTTNKDHASKEHQARVDAILDKISKSGYEKLSKEEKDFLFKASNK